MAIKKSIKTADVINLNFLCNNAKGLQTSKKNFNLFN